MARDCPDRARGGNWREMGGPPQRARIENTADSEYEKLMNELGGGGEGGSQRQIGWEESGAGGEQQNVRPWQRGPTGAPAPWAQNRQATNPAPWNNPNRGGGYDNSYNGVPPPPPPSNGSSLPPWQQQNRGPANPAPWAANGNMGGGYNQGGYGGGGYGAAPWQQQQQQSYYDAPPPPPPNDAPPPPPPSDVPPPPPPTA